MIKLDNVSFRYSGTNKDSLSNISLTVKEGECVVLTGASGCGKTTVTRVLNGLVTSFYDGDLSGGIYVDSVDVTKQEPHELSQRIGSVFQNPRTQFFTTDTDSELVFGMENCGVSYQKMQKAYDDTKKQLRLEELCGRDIFSLSGGEKQRIAFGSIFALSPNVYILDEPSANLDETGIEQLQEILQVLKNQGKTILIAEHRIYYLKTIADFIISMKDGGIIKNYPIKELTHLSTTDLNSIGMRGFEFLNVTIEDKDTVKTDAIIEVKNLSFAYSKDRTILENINFSLSEGEIVGVVGRNGRGKTTFAHILCGILKEKRGEILFEGKHVKARKRNKYAYLVMQDPNYQLFCDSLFSELKLFTTRTIPTDEEISVILEELSLGNEKDLHPLSLSGGQKQRLSIALAALSPAKVLVFDEPTSGLDYTNMLRVTHILKALAKKGKGILVITHDNEFLSTACSRIISL